jgi:hypothetical protein
VPDGVYEQTEGLGGFNFVTLVEWESSAVPAKHQESGFNPKETFARLGTEADQAIFKEVGGRRDII